MKRALMTLSTTLLVASTLATAQSHSDKDNLSYAMGYRTGQALKAQSIDINTKQFSQGLTAGVTGAKPAVSDADMQQSLMNMQKKMGEKMQQQYAAEAGQNEKAGAEFLAKNAKEAGVVTTASGLQYKIINAGSGESPTATDTVTVNYEGKLINGTVFDSSYKRGQPATFKVNQVIKGWQEALQLMKPGATWMLYIPSNLAYGKMGAPGAIGPNETLVFKVDLISVKK